jgi:NAD(P)-dependent dehydrogenase (short-subunit alcohol dehydrogenase family)
MTVEPGAIARPPELDGQVALVTGGSRGIGRAIVEHLAGDNARVAFCSRDGEEAQRVAAAIASATGATVRGYAADLTEPDAAAALVAAVEHELGPLRILINNAAAPVYGDIFAVSDAVWERTIATKLLGYMRCARAALPGMIERRYGRIVNVVGIAGERPNPNSVAIGVVNAGLLNLTRALANQVARHGVTVNAVSPGMTATERRLQEGSDNDPALRIPLGRMVEPHEVAHATAILCADGMGAVTGAWIQVDGGMIAR